MAISRLDLLHELVRPEDYVADLGPGCPYGPLFHFLRLSMQVRFRQAVGHWSVFASARSSPMGLVRGISKRIYTQEDEVGIQNTQLSTYILTSPLL